MIRNKTVRLALYLVALALILVLPVRTILSFECPAKEPEEFLFRVGLYDPYDPMRGRYVRLAIRPETCPVTQKELVSGYDMRAFACLKRGTDGFAEVAKIVFDAAKAPEGTTVLGVRVSGGPVWEKGKRHPQKFAYRIDYPFGRFYMNERLAPAAERELARLTHKRMDSASVLVAVYEDGRFAVKSLLFDGRDYREVLSSAQ